MKFLCSFVILAAVFALNDAFPSIDDETRLITDKLMLEKLMRMQTNRDSNSLQCSQDYLTDLTEILNLYNSENADCENATQTQIEALNKDAKAKVEEIQANITSKCSNECSASPSAAEGLTCIETVSSTNSRSLSELSVKAATMGIELTKAIDDAQGVKSLCLQVASNNYTTKSQIAEDKFKKCTQQ